MLSMLDYFQLVFNTTASALNLLAIPVIIFVHSPRLGTYKYFILIYTISAAVYTTSQAVTLGSWHVPENGYLYFCTFTFLPRWIQQSCIFVFIGTFCINMAIICWCFAYRLTAISGHQFFKYKRRIFVGLVFNGTVWTACMLTVLTIKPDQETDDFFRSLLWNLTGKDLSIQGYVGAPFSVDSVPNWRLYLTLVAFAAYTSLAICVIVYCWLKIREKLRIIKETRYTAHLVHYRIYILLSIQTLFPLLFNAVPAISAFMLSMFHIPWQEFILVCGTVISVAQIVDPICTIVLITEYREAILKILGKRPARVEEITTEHDQPNGSKY